MWLSTASHALGDLRDAEAYLEESFDAARGNFPLVQVSAVSLAAELLRLRAEPGLRWSFLSVGQVEGRLSLVVGEYGRKGTSPRLARYPLDPATGLPELDADGLCAPLEVHTGQPHRMQGVAVDGATWWVSASSGEGNPGDLHVGAPGRFRRHKGVLPPGPEDLEWSRPGEQLWCVSEWPGARYVFPVEARRWAVTT